MQGAQPLTARAELDHETLWGAMRRLLDRVSQAFEREGLIDDCLDVLVDVLGADRGLVLLTSAEGGSQIVNARSAKGTLTPAEREEISRTLVREARDTQRCVVWDLRERAAAASESMMALRIMNAFAAPLFARGGKDVRGVLYVDFRDPRKHVERQHVEFFMAAAVLFGAVFEQDQLGSTARASLREARAATLEVAHGPSLDELLRPESMAHLREEIASALASTTPILILGESGTGKTLLANAIAEASGRKPVVRVLLGVSDDLNMLTSDLYGHERGSFSGATQKRVGQVELARGGTLIFDELLNLRPHAQQLLLDFAQFGTYRPLGYESAQPKQADVRIITATNGDLQVAIREGRFREDLYYRLAGVTVMLPPLRERREDLPALAEATLARMGLAKQWTLSLDLRRLLVSAALDWPGNIRQFERVILRARDRAVARDPEGTELRPEHLEPREIERTTAAPSVQGRTTGERWRDLQEQRAILEGREAEVVRAALAGASGTVAQAARDLGIARTTLASKLDALGIPRR